MEITPKLLKEYCKKDGLYSTPHLNDKLYLHYKGFREVKNLEGYTGLKVLWLEGNGLSQISGLEAQTEMRTLYLQENLIERIENLEHMVSGRVDPLKWQCFLFYSSNGLVFFFYTFNTGDALLGLFTRTRTAI